MIENPNVICNDCGFGKQNKELKDKCERLETQLEIAKAVIYSVLHDKFIYENADAGLVMYITRAYQKIKELENEN